MGKQRKDILFLISIGFIFLFFTSACDRQRDASFTIEGTYPIAAVFEDFYAKLGGEEILGPPISGVFNRGEVQYQYAVNALLVFNPGFPYSQRYQLASIALEWDIEEPPEIQPDDLSVPYINGHQVWDEIRPFYKDVGGFLIGLPLTGVKFNSEKNRYEQYFTNVGFYRNASDEPGSVHLMPYGDWFCANKCSYAMQDAIVIIDPDNQSITDIERLFFESARRLGNEFTGPPISRTIMASDGNYEKAFKNIVFYTLPEDRSMVYLRPLPLLLGISPDTPVPPSGQPGMYFYQAQDELGYNVPQYFLDYITLHGSMELSGPPITHLQIKNKGIPWQCFTNYCLEYHADFPEAMRVQTVSMGNEYIEKAPVIKPKMTEPVSSISLHAWERYPLMPSGQLQEIWMTIHENGVPLAGMEFSLTVTLPHGIQRTYYLPPTDSDGQTSILLDSIEAANGSSILYQACVVAVLDRPVCDQGMFLIWDNP